MPNGYTEDIYKGNDTSVRKYLLRVAEEFGFGYFVTHQHDKPMPNEYSPELAKEAVSDYHAEKLEEAKCNLDKFNQLTSEELKEIYNNEIN